MWLLAARNLAKDRLRLAISVGGVAIAVTLIVLIRGLFVAYQTKVGTIFEHVGADLWVVQAGTADQFHSYSILPASGRPAIAAIDGVAKVDPYVSRQVSFELRGERALLYITGFDPADPVTGPVRMEAGTSEVDDRTIVVDRVFAKKNSVAIGDVLTLNGVDLEIAGISAGGDMVMFQYAYTSEATAREILAMPKLDNAYVVELAAGADTEDVRRQIGATSQRFQARTTPEMIAANESVITEGFLPVIMVLLVIGFLVGVTVIGLTIYSAVLEKRREWGVLKAIGARNGQMASVVLVQASLAAAAGYLLGAALAFGAGRAATRWVPAFVTVIRATDLVWVAVAALLMGAAASLVPIGRLSAIDPAEAFRS